MKMKLFALLPCFMALAACVGVSTAMQYDQTVHRIAMPDDTYRVFEHPMRDRIMTTPSTGKVIGQGLAGGATFGLVETMTPEVLQRAAAKKYLDDTGRANCVITRSNLILKPQYEFFFECPA
ncbi:hypothetical protein [Mesorhizobium muleiense]|uniref:hypothetical protein n=1 Tax=Mesorhizobium muleiense TaxID=1004279 RepID=UPI001F31CB3F|nr:hypothetical protein [Mesorhizobium muleiense]MCF6112004.1 hypothetical protein [Mesorhizobium muleiense]